MAHVAIRTFLQLLIALDLVGDRLPIVPTGRTSIGGLEVCIVLADELLQVPQFLIGRSRGIGKRHVHRRKYGLRGSGFVRGGHWRWRVNPLVYNLLRRAARGMNYRPRSRNGTVPRR